MAYARADRPLSLSKGRKRVNRVVATQNRGHPTKFTPANRDRILHLLRNACPMTTAPAVVGVAYVTFREWMAIGQRHQDEIDAAIAEGREPEPSDFADFVKDVNRALAECEAALVEQVMKAATGFKLTKVKKTSRIGPNGQPIETTEVEQQDVMDWRAGLEILARRFGHNFKREPENTVNVGVQINLSDEDRAIAEKIARRRLGTDVVEQPK